MPAIFRSRSHALRGNAVKGALRRESRPASCLIRDAARPTLHSHAARGNEGNTDFFKMKTEVFYITNEHRHPTYRLARSSVTV